MITTKFPALGLDIAAIKNEFYDDMTTNVIKKSDTDGFHLITDDAERELLMSDIIRNVIMNYNNPTVLEKNLQEFSNGKLSVQVPSITMQLVDQNVIRKFYTTYYSLVALNNLKSQNYSFPTDILEKKKAFSRKISNSAIKYLISFGKKSLGIRDKYRNTLTVRDFVLNLGFELPVFELEAYGTSGVEFLDKPLYNAREVLAQTNRAATNLVDKYDTYRRQQELYTLYRGKKTELEQSMLVYRNGESYLKNRDAARFYYGESDFLSLFFGQLYSMSNQTTVSNPFTFSVKGIPNALRLGFLYTTKGTTSTTEEKAAIHEAIKTLQIISTIFDQLAWYYNVNCNELKIKHSYQHVPRRYKYANHFAKFFNMFEKTVKTYHAECFPSFRKLRKELASKKHSDFLAETICAAPNLAIPALSKIHDVNYNIMENTGNETTKCILKMHCDSIFELQESLGVIDSLFQDYYTVGLATRLLPSVKNRNGKDPITLLLQNHLGIDALSTVRSRINVPLVCNKPSWSSTKLEELGISPFTFNIVMDIYFPKGQFATPVSEWDILLNSVYIDSYRHVLSNEFAFYDCAVTFPTKEVKVDHTNLNELLSIEHHHVSRTIIERTEINRVYHKSHRDSELALVAYSSNIFNKSLLNNTFSVYPDGTVNNTRSIIDILPQIIAQFSSGYVRENFAYSVREVVLEVLAESLNEFVHDSITGESNSSGSVHVNFQNVTTIEQSLQKDELFLSLRRIAMYLDNAPDGLPFNRNAYSDFPNILTNCYNYTVKDIASSFRKIMGTHE